MGYYINSDDRWVPYHATIDLSSGPKLNEWFPRSMIKRGCVYAGELMFMLDLMAYVERYSTGTVTSPQNLPAEPNH